LKLSGFHSAGIIKCCKVIKGTQALILMLRRIVVTAGMIISIVICVAAQNSPITFSIKSRAPATPLKAGDTFTVQLVAQIKEGWHLYSTTQQAGGPAATRITLPPGQYFKLAGAITAPSPLTDLDPNFGIDTQFYEDSAVFTVPVVVAISGPVSVGKQQLQVNVFFQTCNDRFCLPPKTVKLISAVEVATNSRDEKQVVDPDKAQVPTTASSQPQEGAQSPQQQPGSTQAAAQSPTPSLLPTADADKADSTSQPVAVAASSAEPSGQADGAGPTVFGRGVDPNQSLLSFVWLAMSLGALSLLTPCVFPMVPITVSYFTNHAGESRAKAVRDALIYSIGIILTFTALGMLLALFVGAAGINQFAANPWINLLITAIFLSFAMNLFGIYQIQIPSRVLTALDAATRRKGNSRIIGLLLMGLTFTLTSFTCTSPFVGTLLVMASQGHWQWPLVGMLAFSTVFSLPFFILALAPQLLLQLPRSGGWLNSVKVIMGLLEVAAAMKFLSNVDLVWHWGVFTREVVLAVWAAVALLMAFHLSGKLSLTHDSTVERAGAVRLTFALVCLAVSFYLLTGLFGRRLGEIESFLPPMTVDRMTATGMVEDETDTGEPTWIMNDYEGALAKAGQENKLVLIDFTGYTCTNCRWMEANMFPQTEVKRELKKYVRVRLYTDAAGKVYEQQQQLQEQKFGTVALPFYAIVDATGRPLASFPGLTRNPAEFISFLQSSRK
jgi:thiol:disulfide interchange protein DsbD